MGHDSPDVKPLWLVHPRLDASTYRDRLMGSVVAYPHLPTERHIPCASARLPRDMVTNLDPKPVRLRDMAFWHARIHDAHAAASLSDALRFFAVRARASRAAHVATVARMWHMDAPADKFAALLRDPQYHAELLALLRAAPHRAGYFVTDIVTAANLETRQATAHGAGAGGGFTVPAGAGAEASWRLDAETGADVTYEDEMIVFVGYRLVRLEKLTGARARLRAMLRGPRFAFAVQHAADYWPAIRDGPVPGQVEPFLGAALREEQSVLVRTASRQLADEAIVRELTFDIEVVG
ncbi:hypothetical protein CCM_09147 [Cordyceps militaris CM01]|uniref:Uncharacterized protein n=1 Tax=Cordyceps militaris (strain CM01) TaxID=983644 RepID=G3JTK7_CORMM|nr:uncharacterized protein CCM_09147 [Cordyceps militaris CM01]EGX88011.1 hypothetical protein CCM_09147 [Cordyceps militaris CM01]